MELAKPHQSFATERDRERATHESSSIVAQLRRRSLALSMRHKRNDLLPLPHHPIHAHQGVHTPLPRPLPSPHHLDLLDTPPLAALRLKQVQRTPDLEAREPTETPKEAGAQGGENGAAAARARGGREGGPGQGAEGERVEGCETAFRGAAGV